MCVSVCECHGMRMYVCVRICATVCVRVCVTFVYIHMKRMLDHTSSQLSNQV